MNNAFPLSNAFLIFVISILLLLAIGCSQKRSPEGGVTLRDPNIVYMLVDDMGYGDVSVYNPAGKIKTPHIDKLASRGMRFTDAHSPSSVCTPTRYTLLTGQYPWRSRLPKGVLRGYGRSLIERGDFTIGAFLQKHGYHTCVIGKWHLGLDWVVQDGHAYAMQPGSYAVNDAGLVQDMDPVHIDFAKPPTAGPLKFGFDYSFILPASLDMDPYCYLRKDTLTELPSGYTEGNDLHTGYIGAFWRAGKIAPSFAFDQVLNTFTREAIGYLEDRAEKQQPFFLYLPFAAPHTPWVPTDDFKGKSGAGTYGDFVQMVDDAIGKILVTLDQLDMEENTIVILASDNGPFWRPLSVEEFQHHAAGPFRGMKADIWEGGHRIPFIVRWPGKVQPGTVSSATTTLANLAATCADILQVKLAPGEAIDSYSILPVLQGKTDSVPGQKAVIHHSSMGYFAIRQGPWKMIENRGSGGFSVPVQYEPLKGEPAGQLYNLETDQQEKENLYDQYPGKVRELKNLLPTSAGRTKDPGNIRRSSITSLYVSCI